MGAVSGLAVAIVLLVTGGLIGAWVRGMYRSSFDAGVEQAEKDAIRLPQSDLLRLHWLAINGFHRLLVIGERGSGGFKKPAEAQEAHWTLERLEYHLPKVQVIDQAFDREGAIIDRWPDEPLSPPRKLLKQWRLDNEP